MITSSLGIAGILLTLIGVVMTIIGIILIIVNQNRDKPWYIWFLLIIGIIVGITGAIMMAVAITQVPKLAQTINTSTKTYVVSQNI